MPVTKSILIVDDDKIVLDMLAEAFRFKGYKVFTAEDGNAGLKIFDTEQIDIVLTDIRMPGLSGEALATRIRKKSPYTKVAVMTGGDGEIGSNLIKNGTADHFFQKPFALYHVYNILSSDSHDR